MATFPSTWAAAFMRASGWAKSIRSTNNTRGIRNDVVAALRDTHIPDAALARRLLCRRISLEGWHRPTREAPYDGQHPLGRRDREQPVWHPRIHGPVRAAGCEPYICGNVGSGTVQEMQQWVEYMTFDGNSPMADLRRQTGATSPGTVNTSASATKTGAVAAVCGQSITLICTVVTRPTRGNYGENRCIRFATSNRAAFLRGLD